MLFKESEDCTELMNRGMQKNYMYLRINSLNKFGIFRLGDYDVN